MNDVSPFTPIDHVPLHERVYGQIRDALVSGHFAPGQKLTSRAVAASLKTSDMPVRAALSRLVVEGGLTQMANGTTIVPLVSRDIFEELMDLRAVLEARATLQAAPNIGTRDIAKLRKLSAELATAQKDGDIVAYLEKNRKLKFSIYSLANAPTLVMFIDMLWLRVGPFLRHLSAGLDGIMNINFHDQAIDALQARNGTAAAAAIARDIDEGKTLILATADFAAMVPSNTPVLL